MDALILEPTENTPKVALDHTKDHFEIAGESRPEDVRKFYDPIIDWLDKFDAYLYWLGENSSEKKKILFTFRFEYFNSSSAKYIMDIMTKLSDIQDNCKNAKIDICWNYDEPDEDMLEAGEEFKNITNLPFTFVPVKR